MKKLLLMVASFAALLWAGCSTVKSTLSQVPGLEFESWSHVGHYGLFTDKVTVSGAHWVRNADGSATLEIAQYDGEAAWAGLAGPRDTLSKLKLTFPADSAQAKALAPPSP